MKKVIITEDIDILTFDFNPAISLMPLNIEDNFILISDLTHDQIDNIIDYCYNSYIDEYGSLDRDINLNLHSIIKNDSNCIEKVIFMS